MSTRERPILMSAPMVRALLEGRKTVTRRIVKSPAKNMQAAGMEVIKHRPPGDPWYKDHVWSMRGSMGVWGDYTHDEFMALCPHGKPGDRLWVKETIRLTSVGQPGYMTSGAMDYARADYVADGAPTKLDTWPWKRGQLNSIHCPRGLSRITLEIVSVRVERLHDITEADAVAEGIEPINAIGPLRTCGWRDYSGGLGFSDPRLSFASLWMSINGTESWDANPWAWRIEFRRVA